MPAAANNYVQDQLELDECLSGFRREVCSVVEPRWKRKAATAARTPASSRKRSRAGLTPGKKARGGATPQHDRFIPNRSAMDLENAHFNLMLKENASSAANCNSDSPTRAEFSKTLASAMGAGQSRVLAFKKKAPAPAEGHENSLKVLYTQNKEKMARTHKVQRHISSAPERVLDAPELLDDYYLNLMDWGSSNLLAVALGQTVYLWNAATGGIDELCQCEGEDDYITSVRFAAEGGYLAVGTNYAETKLYDVETSKMLRSMNGHSARVSSMSWNQHVLSTGSRDSTIVNHDVRVSQHNVASLRGHLQEVCGLSWSPDGQTLASGGNDNLLCLWDARNDGGAAQQAPRLKLSEHLAAVKALAWCPHQRNVLASGGGTADRTIKMWNAANGAVLNSVDTGSQVCSLLWNPHEKELLSSHGFSENQLCLWKYPSMVRTKELTGHTSRVLHMAMSPDGTTVCSAAADETLRFWKVFEPAPAVKCVKRVKGAAAAPRGALNGMNIR